jgi:hypothetical protein
MAHPRLHDLPAERIVLDTFRVQQRWTRAALRDRLDLDRGVLDGAIVGLLVEGVLCADRDTFLLAPCVTHLDLLASATPNGPPRAPDAATMDRILSRSAEVRQR